MGLSRAQYQPNPPQLVWAGRTSVDPDRWPTSCIGPVTLFTARFILFALVLAQLADAATFMVGVSRFGIDLESNGFASALYHAGGLDAVLLIKGAVLVATVTILAYRAHRFQRLLVWGGAAATSFGLIGFVANTTSILILS